MWYGGAKLGGALKKGKGTQKPQTIRRIRRRAGNVETTDRVGSRLELGSAKTS